MNKMRNTADAVSDGRYTVLVESASDSKASHAASASLVVYGARGRSQETELTNTGDHFQAGHTDEFEVRYWAENCNDNHNHNTGRTLFTIADAPGRFSVYSI